MARVLEPYNIYDYIYDYYVPKPIVKKDVTVITTPTKPYNIPKGEQALFYVDTQGRVTRLDEFAEHTTKIPDSSPLRKKRDQVALESLLSWVTAAFHIRKYASEANDYPPPVQPW